MTYPVSAGLGALAVFLICIGCYLTGEVFDQREDMETLRYGRNPFSGGTLLVANGTLTARRVFLTAALAFVAAGAIGVAIVVVHRSVGLLCLGTFGILSAILYSTPPIRLVKRGLGELFIAICYGWLTVVTGYASASGQLLPYSYFIAVPVALTVFNIILINEFPDYEADGTTGKRTLLVRVGRVWGARIYALAALITAVSLLLLWFSFGGDLLKLALVIPVAALALWLAVGIGLLGRWRERRTLEPMCGASIVLNLLTAVTLAVVVRWS
jgi:1,4-dihydroxy-2-naphthoate octaprenyltransferase